MEEVEEICEIRKVDEVLAARWAMRRITPSEVQALEKNLGLRSSGAEWRLDVFVERDAEFHEIFVRAAAAIDSWNSVSCCAGTCSAIALKAFTYRKRCWKPSRDID